MIEVDSVKWAKLGVREAGGSPRSYVASGTFTA